MFTKGIFLSIDKRHIVQCGTCRHTETSSDGKKTKKKKFVRKMTRKGWDMESFLCPECASLAQQVTVEIDEPKRSGYDARCGFQKVNAPWHTKAATAYA